MIYSNGDRVRTNAAYRERWNRTVRGVVCHQDWATDEYKEALTLITVTAQEGNVIPEYQNGLFPGGVLMLTSTLEPDAPMQ